MFFNGNRKGRLVAYTAFFFEGINGNGIFIQKKMRQHKRLFNTHATVAEITFVDVEQHFPGRVVQINAVGAVKVQFNYAQ